ncbi:histidine kinase [Maritimibacter sp. 55A14]|nr:histidine kinase [Maritimibacter sp. 55A14]
MLLGFTAVFGAALWYFQTQAYYTEVAASEVEIRITRVGGGETHPLAADGLRAIDAETSPLKFRACFTTPASLAMLTETYEIYDAASPLTAPGWFECFDAAAIGRALETGEAIAFMGERDVAEGAHRIIAVFDDGRAYAWHQLTEEYAEQ